MCTKSHRTYSEERNSKFLSTAHFSKIVTLSHSGRSFSLNEKRLSKSIYVKELQAALIPKHNTFICSLEETSRVIPMDALTHKYLQNKKQNILPNCELCKNQTAHTQPVHTGTKWQFLLSFLFAPNSPFPAQDLYLVDQQAPQRHWVCSVNCPFASLLS